MWIYKITNLINNKVYIGQTIRPIEDRFKRHISDAINNVLDTHLARRIKRTNILTNEVDIFDTVIESARASGIQNGKTSITQRLNGKTKSPFKGIWIYEYCD